MNSNHPDKKKIIGILQPGYLPWLGFFEQISRCDLFILYDDVQYEKGSWRNRNRIKTANGCQWLTVPVLLKGKQFPLIKDVQINKSQSWQKKHIKAIAQNYSKAKYYQRYSASLFEILEQNWAYLVDLDIKLIYWLKDQLCIATPIVRSSDLKVAGHHTQRLINIIKNVQGNYFYEGQAGKNYIDPFLFEAAGLAVIFQDYQHPTYHQLYGDFVSHLSIIDLLFNCGPDSLQILNNA